MSNLGSGAAMEKTPMDETERRILAIATDAFDNEEKAHRWMYQRNIELGDQRPVDIIGTPEGFHAVERVLNCIKWAMPV